MKSLSPSSPPAVQLPNNELRYTIGAFYIKSDSEIDEDVRKFKYPFVTGERLLFLQIEGSQFQMFAYTLADLLDNSSEAIQPQLVYPKPSTRQGDLFATDKRPQLVAFFRGPAFLEKSDAEAWRLWSVPQDTKPLLIGQAVRDYLDEEPWGQAWVSEKGLIVNGQPVFSCGEVFSFDRRGSFFVLGYHDQDGYPRVCLMHSRSETSCDCTPVPGNSKMFAPQFSKDGRFLAVAARRQEGWELHIYAVRSSSTVEGSEPVAVLKNIAFYDIQTEVFVYQGSYAWLGNSLFFQTRSDKRAVYQVDCQERQCGPQRPLMAPSCFRIQPLPEERVRNAPTVVWAPSAGDCTAAKDVEGQVNLREIVWSQPFRHKGQIYLAVQAVVKPQAPFAIPTRWLSRILVFQVP